MNLRDATHADAPQISELLKELTAAGKRQSPDDVVFVTENYIEDAQKIRCTVAEEDGVILGFQSLRLAEVGNKYGVEPGWGIIGTHIRPTAARRGVGRALFKVTQSAAKDAGLQHVDATIGSDNTEGLAYYGAMGFKEYKTLKGAVYKRLDVAP